jgi:organic radical activating enzyme
MRKLRLLIEEKCNRNCEGCCNKDFDLKNLPVERNFSQYQEIILTGGEPFLDIQNIVEHILFIKKKNKKAKIILYTAKYSKTIPMFLKYYIDGITVTLHEQNDIEGFFELNDLLNSLKWDCLKEKSFRLNVFSGIDLGDWDNQFWNIKDNIVWIKDCPLPDGESFMRSSLI